MTDKLIETGWLELAQQALPHDSQGKINTCRTFFYAGAAHCLALVLSVSDDDVAMEDGLALLTAIEDELERFRLQFEDPVHG